MSERIKALLMENCCKSFTPSEIARKTGISRESVHRKLKDLPDVIEKINYGKYRWKYRDCLKCKRLEITGGFVEGICRETGEKFCVPLSKTDWQRPNIIPKGPMGDKEPKEEL